MIWIHAQKPGALGYGWACLPNGLSEQGLGRIYARMLAAHAPRPTFKVRVHMQLYQSRKLPWQEGRHLKQLISR